MTRSRLRPLSTVARRLQPFSTVEIRTPSKPRKLIGGCNRYSGRLSNVQ